MDIIKDDLERDNSDFIKKLDDSALKLQKDPNDEEAFAFIHSCLHKFIMGQAFHRFSIRGHEGKDLYQEALIVLWQKAIPGFRNDKGMSFFGFAKMCISRHLITILNSAIHRKKDMPMNRSISLDEVFNEDDEDSNCSLQNVFEDKTDFFKDICYNEDKNKTIDHLKNILSPFESLVLYYYLDGLSYRQIAYSISLNLQKDFDEKSVDNALLRIRRKATDANLSEQLPLFKK